MQLSGLNRYDSEYDDETKAYLGDLCLNSYFEAPLRAEYQHIINWVLAA